MKRIFALCLSLTLMLLCFGAFGCNRVKGEYVLKQIEVGDQIFAVGSEFYGEKITADSIKLDFGKDGVLTVTFMGETVTGTWEKEKGEDEDILVTIANATTRIEIEDKYLEWDYLNGMKIILEKA